MLPEIKNLAEFNDVTNKDKVAVIDFWAAWCLPCKAISPVFEVFATRFPELGFYKVNVSEARDVSQAAGIRGLPTFQTWQRGTKIGEVAGADRSKLEDLVTEASIRR
ncbi:hypothetical protein QCA50_015294 [Cerrena zonata]|uniref:Thioredoxin n=1 Tax=Cerrena zonata TaxID=2478898 RepID=A0AAW0FN15_9APHY